LNGLLGNSNSACAKTSLIDDLNILGKISQMRQNTREKNN
jgi:hypothetical protein